MTSRYFLTSLAEALLRERFASPATVQRVQQRRLKHLLQHAARYSPFNGRRIQPAGSPLEQLQRIRPVDVREMMDNFPDTVCGAEITLTEARAAAQSEPGKVARVRDRWMVSQTSGTTGEPGYFLNDHRSVDIQRGVVFARTFRDRLAWKHVRRFIRRRYRMAFVVTRLSGCISTQTCLLGKQQSGRMAEIRLFPSEDPIAEIVRGLNEYQPDYVHGYASMLELLAYQADDGALKIRPEFISSGSEGFSKAGRAAVERVFAPAVVTSQYGSTECSVLGNECRAGQMHVNSDYLILEGVDENDQLVPPGVKSHQTLLTNLVNLFQPIIRFRLTDSISWQTTPCPCGSPLPTIQLEGRSDEMLWLERGPSDFVSCSPPSLQAQMYPVAGIRQWQLIQTQRNHLRIRFVKSPGVDGATVAADIRQNFRKYLDLERLGTLVEVTPEEVDMIPRTARGQKLKQIISEVVAPPRKVRSVE
ncbi:MAG: phenylacetate--CoA ligase family protein [Planctomyces sp.]